MSGMLPGVLFLGVGLNELFAKPRAWKNYAALAALAGITGAAGWAGRFRDTAPDGGFFRRYPVYQHETEEFIAFYRDRFQRRAASARLPAAFPQGGLRVEAP
ncbi:MAG: hypothetical protein M5R36_00230 [Deltaproteobacteria bacterium]|nr:hypothetical protein [Deltaproteobacteria bacterium]